MLNPFTKRSSSSTVVRSSQDIMRPPTKSSSDDVNTPADSLSEKKNNDVTHSVIQLPIADQQTAETAQALKLDPSSRFRKGKELKKDKKDKKTKEAEADKAKNEKERYAHLPEHEAAVLYNQVHNPQIDVGYWGLFRYASALDWTIFVISVFCSVVAGAGMPLMTVVFGGLTGEFADFFNGKSSFSEFQHTLSHMVLYFVYLAIGIFITTTIYMHGFLYVGEHCAAKIRSAYLASLLRQNMGFFDNLGSGEVTTRITDNTNEIQDGISEKLGLVINAVATFISAFVIAFIRAWKLTTILLSGVVSIILIMGSGGTFMKKWKQKTQQCYAEGGTVAEEVLGSIRNATAFNTQEKLARQYDEFLYTAEAVGRKFQASQGAMLASMFCIINLIYGLAFWEGSRLLVDGDITLSRLITSNFAVIIGSFGIGNVAPFAQAFAAAAAAGKNIFSVISRTSPIDPDSDAGLKPEFVRGEIELQKIKHIYPSRPEVVVMDGVNLVIPAGKQTAIVGASGSGKSTIVGLVERFYDPVGGKVLLDGVNLQEINIRWLRENVSFVQQEPVLFSATVLENIRYGLTGDKFMGLGPEKERELIVNAAIKANAHDFITGLPDGYKTRVGVRGFLLSGGQKQRIAIARAIVSDPRILLLDEATSALDTKNEGLVQAALDRAAEGRTTITIAHRLSTIKTADKIVVMQRGRIVEQGTHDELIDQKGAYYNLVQAQQIHQELPESSDSSAEEVESVETSLEDLLINEKQTLELGRTQTGKSISSLANEKRRAEVGEKEKTYGMWILVKLVWSFNRKEWYIVLTGLIFSVIAGAGNPVQTVFFAKSISTLSLPPSQYGELRHQINFWALMYLMLAFALFFAYGIYSFCFGYCQETIIHRARLEAFRTMLRQDIGWFDREENTSGSLTSFLSTTVTELAGLSGTTLGALLSVSTTLVASFTLATVVGWKLALVCACAIPLLIGCGYVRFAMLARLQERSKLAYLASAGFACEQTNAIQTVASLTRERDVVVTYSDQLTKQERDSVRPVVSSSILFATSQSLVFLCTALGFWWGGTLIGKGELSMFAFFLCFQAIVFGAQSVGIMFSFAPDMGKAKNAAKTLKTLFDRKPPIDSWSENGERLANMEGFIEFRDVHFRYPTRPDDPVLRGLNLRVKPGQYVALVGPSGCGKSTTISLMERFYDPLAGGVYVDGKEISTLHVNTYRSFLALVGQEPTLYQGTIKENILLGGDSEDISESEVIEACKDANIYDFILSLPDGFSTDCGSKGTLLSGGQKQRIAIARALIRKPKILLLDEATSALDSESEKVVQAALDKAARGRTTIAVAHRLSTIQKADVIYVIERGRVVESGNHAELLAQKGKYAELVTLQSLEKITA